MKMERGRAMLNKLKIKMPGFDFLGRYLDVCLLISGISIVGIKTTQGLLLWLGLQAVISLLLIQSFKRTQEEYKDIRKWNYWITAIYSIISVFLFLWTYFLVYNYSNIPHIESIFTFLVIKSQFILFILRLFFSFLDFINVTIKMLITIIMIMVIYFCICLVVVFVFRRNSMVVAIVLNLAILKLISYSLDPKFNNSDTCKVDKEYRYCYHKLLNRLHAFFEFLILPTSAFLLAYKKIKSVKWFFSVDLFPKFVHNFHGFLYLIDGTIEFFEESILLLAVVTVLGMLLVGMVWAIRRLSEKFYMKYKDKLVEYCSQKDHL